MEISVEYLKKCAGKLMFDMDDKEYTTLQGEFEVILKHMDLISRIEGIGEVEPMTFPFIIPDVTLRKDEVKNMITNEEALRNAKEVVNGEIRVPKVVE